MDEIMSMLNSKIDELRVNIANIRSCIKNINLILPPEELERLTSSALEKEELLTFLETIKEKLEKIVSQN